MKTKIIAAIALGIALLTGSAQAQYTDNFQTNTISGVASNWAGDYFVGANFSDDILLIQAGGVLSNGFAYVGYQFGADNNTVLVTDPGSAWSNANDLSVGYLGALNSMTISNGGTVYNATGYIGNQADADDNAVLVTGSGSVWSNAFNLFVGNNGAENSLTIASGGVLYNGYGYIGNSSIANYNTVLVTGSGSVWNNANNLSVGIYGSHNSLTIASNGTVYNVYGYIGSQAGANHNTVLVSGSGSVWNNGTNLDVGSYGTFNSLDITSSGTVYSGSSSIGYYASNNTVLVTDSGSVWTNTNYLIVGWEGAGNSLTIASGGTVYDPNGYIGLGGDDNATLVTGSGSVWNNVNSLTVGASGSGNSLTISNGAVVMVGVYGYIGSAGNNNTVVVADGGSLVVTNAAGNAELIVSQAGGVNSLILNSGTVTANQLALFNGLNSIFTFNAGILNSGGTFVTTPQNFAVGDGIDPAVFHLLGGDHSFVNGSLEIQNNAELTGCGTISGNVLIDAGGTVLADCGGTFTFIGSVTNNGSIVATNGTTINFYGTVINNGQIGPTNNVHYYPIVPSTGDTNSWISPASDKWENGSDWSAGPPSIIQPAVYITNASSKTVTIDTSTAIAFTNTMSISNLTVSGPSGSTNTLVVDAIQGPETFPLQIVSNLSVQAGGIVSVVSSALEIDRSGAVPGHFGFFVGINSAGEQWSLSGGQVNDPDGYIGYNSSSSNNAVLVSGPGSVWSNAFDLFVGVNGAGNSLTISNGATVYSGGVNGFGVVIGYSPSSSNNTVLVSGPGSVWKAEYLVVGYEGAGNSLTITNGAVVTDGEGDLGYQPSANSNTVLVTGSGSVWSNANNLYVGNYSAGNSLTITNGAVVMVGGDGYIGYQVGDDSNTVLVTGNGAVWRISGVLYVGSASSSNQLIVGTGGTVIASNAVIGLDYTEFGPYLASNNVLQVTGGSLFVTNSSGGGRLSVGQSTGPGALILNSGSVTVNQLVITNGANGVFTFNAGTLASGGTFVTNNQVFVVGDGTDAATFHLNGGVHSFADNLEISNNATLSGCGTIEGNVTVDPGGTVLADCGATLTFTGIVTNNGTMLAVNGTTLQAYGQVVNNGTINAIDGSVQFLGGLVNNGCVLTKSDVQISSVTRSGTDLTVQIPSGGSCATYQLQVTPSLKPATWTNLGASQSGTGGVLTFTDTGGATNRPSRFYRIDVTLP